MELAYPLSLAASSLAAALACLLLWSSSGCADPPGGNHPAWSVPAALPGAEPFEPQLRARLERALRAMPPDYKPRTRHLDSHGGPRYTNRLILESSPYLLQHAHNPVNWYPWGEEAFAAARRLGRPILLSVGYATCHWCHVMERESFEDEEIATFINRHYIAIKVDREERPDIDRVYMEAVQLLSGRGGWPMTVIMMPDGRPFFAGTYFPPRDGERGARVGLLTLLKRLAAYYREHPDDILARAEELSKRIREQAEPRPAAGVPGAGAIARAVGAFKRSFDQRWGGFGRAPKFPRPAVPELLLRYWRRAGDEESRRMVVTTLRAMARGGIHDQIGGGFHRYSTDDRWLVPHFEKMLYDNAQLAALYLEAYQATGEQEFAEVARRTLDYAIREMSNRAGGFYSATDADSPTPSGEHREGWFFTWTPAEIEAVLEPETARLVEAYYGVTREGNFEGRTILAVAKPLADVAAELGIPLEQAGRRLEHAREVLYRERSRRLPPATDDKSVAAWNGLMISALARASLVLGEPRYLERARQAARFVLEEMAGGSGELVRSWKDGRKGPPAVLDDYAFVATGLIDLFEASGESRWLEEARRLHRTLEDRFWDAKGGGFYFTPTGGPALLVRDKPSYDGAEPSGNSVAAIDLLRLYELTGEESYRQRLERLLAYFGVEMERHGPAVPKLLCALDAYLDKTKEIVIVVPSSREQAVPFLRELARTYLPNRILVVVEQDRAPELAHLVPLVAGKAAREGKATAYVCEDRTCELPTSDPQVFAKQIAAVRPYPPS